MQDLLKEVARLTKLFQKIWTNKEFGFSFNVADRCPIGCDCYWRAQARVKELSDDEAVEFFHTMKERGYLLATLVGGEPYVRPGLLAKLTPIMPANWLVTSGTSPFQRFPKTTHFVSIDGASAETHDDVRKSSGLYLRILRNLERVRGGGELFPAFIHTVINSRNQTEVRQILEVWRTNGLADGVIFSTHTPIKNSMDDRLRLTRDERVAVVATLLGCKDEFGDFLVNTPTMIRAFRPDATALQTPATCGTARYVPSFDAAGKRIKQCILSEKADCTQCGCVVTAIMETVIHFPPKLDSLRVLKRLRTR